MSFTVESNVTEVIARLNHRAQSFNAHIEVTISNHVSYAAAVDQGYVREIVWAELTFSQRAAIILAMEKNDGKPRKWDGKGLQVNQFRDGKGRLIKSEIIVPGVNMLARAIAPVKQFGRWKVINRLPSGFGPRHLKMAALEIAEFAHSKLVDLTPVDESVLVKGWGVTGP